MQIRIAAQNKTEFRELNSRLSTHPDADLNEIPAFLGFCSHYICVILRNDICVFAFTQTDQVQRVEVDMMLRTVLEFKQNESAQIALVAHCLAMLWFLEGDRPKVR